MNLRREAIDRVCQIRLEGCEGGPCCLCHWRQLDISGMGMKSPDQLGAWGCGHCHAIVDTHKADTAIQLDFAKAVFRTQAQLIREGKIQ
jgi:hypothetical protein